MAFKKMTATSYPPRLWGLTGEPGSGKTTFATRMHSPLLGIDADQRFREVLSLAGDVYALSDTPADNTNPERIAALLAENMPGSDVGTIVVDSLTTIIAPLVMQALKDREARLERNRVAREKDPKAKLENLMTPFQEKAIALRILQDAVSKWGTDVLWIWHLQEGRDENGKEQVTQTISKTELARLTRSINLQLEIVQDGDRRGVKVTWARRGRSGMILWDMSGCWSGMPEAIEKAVYDGLTQAEQDAIEGNAPAAFPSPDKAIAWGFEQGVFKALQHAQHTYDELKREKQPKTAEAMRDLWVADVQRRRAERSGAGE